jgi:hypothetical protein
MSDETTDRLTQLQAELNAVLAERLAALTAAVRATEATSRRLLGAALRAASIGVVLVDVRGAAPRISFANDEALITEGCRRIRQFCEGLAAVRSR